MNFSDYDISMMNKALEQAEIARSLDEVPVGAVIVCNNQVISVAYNRREKDHQATAHAELIAIQQACTILGRWRLIDCELFVTLEPCLMCTGAIINARLRRVIIGAKDPKAGAVTSLYTALSDPRLNHRPEVVFGPLEEQCSQILTDFFRNKRKRNT